MRTREDRKGFFGGTARVFVLAAVMAFAVCGCGGDDGGGSRSGQKESAQDEQSAQGKNGAQGGQSSLPGSAEDGQSVSETGKDTAQDRHYYKTVAFYGPRFRLMEEQEPSSGGNSDYKGAVVFDYDTETGELERARVVQYYEVSDISGEAGEKATARNKEWVVKYNNFALFERPYTEDFFSYLKGNPDGDSTLVHQKMCAMTWELEPDETAYLLEQHIAWYFSGKMYGNKEKQDIDGFIRSVFYDQLHDARLRPLACFADNGFYSAYGENRVMYTVCWYDTEWSVEMKDEIYPIADRLLLKDAAEPFTVEEYGATSYNTGGGYTGTYDYRNYMP